MTTAAERRVEHIKEMCGGRGEVRIERLLSSEQLNGKCGLYARVAISPGHSLGYHEHHGETETYYLLSGEGVYHDNDKEIAAHAGDVFFCCDGSGHALENTGKEELVFMALIIKG